jgi:hypothetical protein
MAAMSESLNRVLRVIGIAAFWLGTVGARAGMQIIPDAKPQQVFAGLGRPVSLTCRNAGEETLAAAVAARIYQVDSATAAPMADVSWKNIRILPGQTILESARFDFPAVKARTRFIIQWHVAGNVLGTTDVLVYPTNLLDELKLLAGGTNGTGVFDPGGEWSALLKSTGFVDLGNAPLEGFRGKLAVIRSGDSTNGIDASLARTVKELARHGVAVVCIGPPAASPDELQPSFYSVSEQNALIIFVQPELVARPGQDPRSQLNLVYLCKLALKPKSAHWLTTTASDADREKTQLFGTIAVAERSKD